MIDFLYTIIHFISVWHSFIYQGYAPKKRRSHLFSTMIMGLRPSILTFAYGDSRVMIVDC